MCNLLITKHSLCGCTTTLTTTYCSTQRNNPHNCTSTTSITSTTQSTPEPPCSCTAGKVMHRTVNHQCGCHSWEDLYKREDRLTREKERERVCRQIERLEAKREREMMEYSEMEREGSGMSNAGLLTPDAEEGGRADNERGKKGGLDEDGDVEMRGRRETTVESVEN